MTKKQRQFQCDDLISITNEEIIVLLLKETIQEKVAKKLLVEFRMAGYEANQLPHKKSRITFHSHGYIIPNYIDLKPGSFSISTDLFYESTDHEVKEYSYSVENIESVFNEICDENDYWEENNLIIEVTRVEREKQV